MAFVLQRLMNVLQQAELTPERTRRHLLRAMKVELGARSKINPGCSFIETTASSGRTVFGQDVFMNRGCYIESSGDIHIGDRVWIGPQVMILTATHAIGEDARRAGERISLPVSIGDGCWIGARAVLLPGVTVARGCVIAAGAVIASDTEPDAVYAGVPARQKRKIS